MPTRTAARYSQEIRRKRDNLQYAKAQEIAEKIEKDGGYTADTAHEDVRNTASVWIPHVTIPHLGGCLTALLLELPK